MVPNISGAADSPPEDLWPLERRLIKDVLNESLTRTDYCRQLIAILDRWREADADEAGLASLPALVCSSCGGDPRQAVAACAAWRLMRSAAKLFDDVQDGDLSEGQPEAINIALGLVFIGLLATHRLAEQGLTPERVQQASQVFCRACLVACGGQHADLGAAAATVDLDPDDWLEIAAAKSGTPFGWAAWVGALVGGADARALTCYRDYGRALGLLLQVADDYDGVWYPDAATDLATGRPTLTSAYALSVASTEERDRLEALLSKARQGDGDAEAKARALMTDLGAQGFLLVVARTQERRASEALREAGCDGPASHPLLAILEHVFPALHKLQD